MYGHDFDLAFCVESPLEEWESLPPAAVLAALRKRVAALTEQDVLEAAGFLATFPLQDRTGETGAANAPQANPEENRPRPRYAEGTRFISLFGESGDTDEAIDVQTGPDAEGVITLVLPEQEGCYMAEFPCGICVFLTEADLEDARYYRVLEDGPGQDGGAGCAP